MRRFESVVMSETEPVSPGTLWLRPKKNTLDSKGPTQFDIWYFSEVGWRPIADFDTRYDFAVEYNPEVSGKSLVITSTPNPKEGIVSDNLTFFVYDGTRNMQNSSNLVLESGLKKEVDTLRSYIDNEIARVDERINTLSSSLDTISNSVSSNTDRVAKVEGRLSLLES